MPVYAEIVHAPPAKVWEALLDLPANGERAHLFASAEREKGRAGETGHTVLYHAGRRAWRETLQEAERGARLRYKQRDEPKGSMASTLEWRLQPSQIGSLLVLEVRGKNGFHSKILHLLRGRWHRRLVRFVKEQFPSPGSMGAMAMPEPEAVGERRRGFRRKRRSDAV